MSYRRTQDPPSPAMILIVSGFLIVAFLWRFFAVAQEYPRMPTRLLMLALDIGLVVALVLLRVRSGRSGEYEAGGAFWRVLFRVALTAGIGLFLIRLTSHDAWVTGHRLYVW